MRYSDTFSKRSKERMARLRRRADWLADRHGATNTDLSFDKSEESALRWAIDLIENFESECSHTFNEEE